MKKNHLQQLIKEELSKALREEVKVSTELDSYIKDNAFNKENSFYYDIYAKNYIQDKINRPLTPQEKSKITRLVTKYRDEYRSKKWKEESDAEDKAIRDRYRNNLLPLTVDNGNGTPDSTYYTTSREYSWTDRDGNVHTSYSDPKSGYTDYMLRDKWVNTPVDKATLDRYWHPGTLAMAGIKK